MNDFPDTLIDGYQRFIAGRFNEERDSYQMMAENGQRPHTLLIACCDSRCAPEVIFDCGPGELFVIRNVANMVPPFEPDGYFHATSAAIEFAVQALRIQNIVVLGHGRCGGIKAALVPGMEPVSAGDFIGKWMSLIKPAAEQIQSSELMTLRERQTALERVSIRNSIDNLRTFPYVRALEGEGKLHLRGAWFDISTGELWLMDQASGDFGRPGVDRFSASGRPQAAEKPAKVVETA